MIAIADNPTTMQMSIVGYLIEAIAIVLLAALLWTALKKQNRGIARWAFGLWIIQAAMLAAREVSLFSLLSLSREFVEAGAPDPSYFLSSRRSILWNLSIWLQCSDGLLLHGRHPVLLLVLQIKIRSKSAFPLGSSSGFSGLRWEPCWRSLTTLFHCTYSFQFCPSNWQSEYG